MRKAILLVILTLAATAHAQSGSNDSLASGWASFCEVQGKVGFQVAVLRDRGVPEQKQLDNVTNFSDDPANSSASMADLLFISAIKWAYSSHESPMQMHEDMITACTKFMGDTLRANHLESR